MWVSRFNLGIRKGITYWTADVTSFSNSTDTHLMFAHISLQPSMVSPIYLGHDIYTFNTTTRWVSISKLSFSTLTHRVYKGNDTHITLVNTKPQQWSNNMHTRLSPQFFWELTSFKWLIIKRQRIYNVVWVSSFNLGINTSITYPTQLISHPSEPVSIPAWPLHIYYLKIPWTGK